MSVDGTSPYPPSDPGPEPGAGAGIRGRRAARREQLAATPYRRDSVLTIVHVYPHLLGTYGDAGNALVLGKRAADRGIPVEVVAVQPGQPLPRSGDIYLLGGGEDAKQTAAAQELRADGGLLAAVERGAAVLGICAGYQLLGETFLGVGGVVTQGLGLLDVRTDRLATRAVGNVLANPGWDLELDELIGFENHGGATTLGADAKPLAKIEVGIGNGGEDGTEGAVGGRVVGTYLHGPVLALNPTLADWLLATAVGPMPPLDDTFVTTLRRHRLDEVIPQTARANRRRALLSAVRRRDDGPSGATATLSAPTGGPDEGAAPQAHGEPRARTRRQAREAAGGSVDGGGSAGGSGGRLLGDAGPAGGSGSGLFGDAGPAGGSGSGWFGEPDPAGGAGPSGSGRPSGSGGSGPRHGSGSGSGSADGPGSGYFSA